MSEIITDNSKVNAKLIEENKQLQRQNADLKADAERYRRSAVLVNSGDWYAGYLIVKDSYRRYDEISMSDKTMMDIHLDKPDVIELSASRARIEYANQLEKDAGK